MNCDQQYREVSPWVEPPADRTPLREDRTADVVIVGAGYTGLSAALSLRARGADVVVLEQEFAGSGASGRNAGHLTPTIGKDLPTTLRLFGRERASALVRFADAAVEYTESVIKEYRIDCHYHASGNIVAGVHPKHEARLRKAADTARGLGARVRFLAPEEMRERGLPPAFVCGILEQLGGTLNPGRYVAGLRDAALRSGVRLFENTRVLRLEDGAKVVARCESGTVTAPQAVIATNAYTEALGRLRRHVIPLRVSLFETEPLNAAQMEELGWRGREGVYTAHEVLENYHVTHEGTISGGSKVVRYQYGSKLPPGRDPAAFAAIEKAFRERFPVLRETRIAHFWGGWLGFTLDLLPQFGVEGTHGNVHFAVGFNGHGIAQATLLGAMVAERIQGGEPKHASALTRRLLRLPPEPLRWTFVAASNGVFSLMDVWTDWQIRRHTS